MQNIPPQLTRNENPIFPLPYCVAPKALLILLALPTTIKEVSTSNIFASMGLMQTPWVAHGLLALHQVKKTKQPKFICFILN